MTRRRRALRIVLAATVAAAAAALAISARSAADTAPTGTPILFLHGYIDSTCPGNQPANVFGTAASVLKARGWTGTPDYLGYYGCDKKATHNIWTYGDPSAYYSGALYSNGGATDNTDIRHIAYWLAWYVYDTYTVHGQPVDIVGHSMGALIARWAVYRVSAGDSLFPPSLLIDDVVAISSPFGGSAQLENPAFCTGTQCGQMEPNSAFLTELHGFVGDARAGTWTAMGGGVCDIMTPEEATWVEPAFKWSYPYRKGAGNPPAKVCYNHTAYLTDTSTAVDMPVEYADPGDTEWTDGVGDHSLAHVADAILGGAVQGPVQSVSPSPTSTCTSFDQFRGRCTSGSPSATSATTSPAPTCASLVRVRGRCPSVPAL